MSYPALRTTAPTPLLAAAIGRPISQFTPLANVGVPGLKGDARVFTATIDWNFYGASAGVPVYLSINIAASSPTYALQSIRSIYIDNTFSRTPVYVYFPDTEFTVMCPALSVVMSPVWTNLNDTAYIYADQFDSSESPIVTVQFSDACHAGYSVAPTALGLLQPGQLVIRRILLVGGGGGGRNAVSGTGGGGGGAGGFIDNAIPFGLASGAYTVTIGAGGAAGSPGLNTSFGSQTAVGGGAGGGGSGGASPGQAGGSGGGGRGSIPGSDNAAQGGAGTPNQGNQGGRGPDPSNLSSGSSGGGGGGAGASGGNGSDSSGNGGNGGAGRASNISGTSILYAGGGGGGVSFSGGSGGAGGAGGGGRGGNGTGNAVSGTANTGGGGGGAMNGTAAAGGSGIVILMYDGPPAATGGTIAFDGTVTRHTFTASGTFAVV